MSRSFHHRRKESANPDWDAMPASWRPVCEKFLHERALKFATALAKGEEWAVKEAVEDGLRALVDDGQDFEIRILTDAGVMSGYFNDVGTAAACIAKWDRKAAIYCTLNPIDPLCHTRAPNRLVEHAQQTTPDSEILKRTRLLIDVDAVRDVEAVRLAGTSAISATESEHDAALAAAKEVKEFLRSQGWPEPLLYADSGNGGQLIYAIDLPNTPESRALVQRVLDALAKRFNNDRVHVDPAVANASRLAKVIGTYAVKGDDTADRPHRRSRIISHA